MRVCVFGAGAIGGHLAVRLGLSGCDVSVVARGAHLEAIRSRGLKLRTQAEEFITHPVATDDANELGPQDAVFVTVKTPALSDIAESLGRLIGPDTAVAFFVNGLPWWYLAEIEPRSKVWSPPLARMINSLDRAVGRERTLGGVVYSANHVPEPGVVFNSSPTHNKFLIGAAGDAMGDKCRSLVAAIKAGGAESQEAEPFVPEIWKKLMLNIVTGPLGAITGATSRFILTDDNLAPLAERITAETMAIARSCGIVDVTNPTARQAATATDHKPSMLQDYEAGRRPEIDTLIGALLDIARQRSIDTPFLAATMGLARARAMSLSIYP